MQAAYMTACSAAMTAVHAAVESISSADTFPLGLCCSSNFLGSYNNTAGFAALGVCSPGGWPAPVHATSQNGKVSEPK